MSNHNFATVPKADIQRSSFDRSHTWKGSFDAGKLIPFFVDEVLPGDTFNLNVSMLCRLATPVVPIMDNLYLDTFFFFVPNRLVWNNFQKFMGEQEDPDDSIDYLVPKTFGGSSDVTVSVNSVMDYMGFPIGTFYGNGTGRCNPNVLPLRGLCLIWNEFFRDENLQDSIKIQKSDTSGYFTGSASDLPNGAFYSSGSCLPRGKRHDYFTSALPWPQKGPAVDVPLGTSAPVITGSIQSLADTHKPISLSTFSGGHWISDLSGPTKHKPLYVQSNSDNTVLNITGGTLADGSESAPMFTPNNLYADLSNATAATINTLRQAFQVQRLLERDALGGTRYIELLRSHFGVVAPDFRLQRPEYLGGSSNPIMVSPVAQTASTDTTSPQGNLAAFGVCAPHFHGFTKSFVEHGYIIGLCCVRADLTYQQGINKMWFRRTRYDFYWPTLAHLGEQAILNKEIFVQGTSDDEGVFGYQERFAEYRYKPSLITGELRSTYSSPLDVWHLAQKFDSLPTLSDDFIRENPPVDRVIAVPSEPQFIMDAYFKLNCVRPMPLYGTPGLIDHY